MMKQLWNRLGTHAAHAVVGGQLQGSRLNMKLGFALLRDRRVSFWPKLFAIGIGGAVAALLVALEISPETLLAFALPGLGLALDFATDGLEAVLVPFLMGALILPFMAPRDLVNRVMAERAGVVAGPVLAPPVA